MAMKIISLNVALPSTQRYEGQEVLTGGTKKPVSQAVLRSHNFDGDGQADLVYAQRALAEYMTCTMNERLAESAVADDQNSNHGKPYSCGEFTARTQAPGGRSSSRFRR